MKRYNWNGDESRNGPIVLYSDHAEALQAACQPVGEAFDQQLSEFMKGCPLAWLIEWKHGVTAVTKDLAEAEAHLDFKNCTVVPVYAAPPQQPERVDLSFMSLRGDDKRVNVDSYKEAIEAARSNIGVRRPDDDEPEDQWYWDKLTSLLALIN